MTTHDDDRDFDAFLRREDDLSAQLGAMAQPVAPPELDARILAQARAALGGPVQAANDAAGDTANQVGPEAGRPLAKTAALLARLRVPLGLAATVVIGVSLGLHWEEWHGQARPAATLTDVPAAPAAQAPEDAAGKATGGAIDEAAAPPPPPEPRAVPRRAKKAATPAAHPAPMPAPAPPPPPPAPAPAPAQMNYASPPRYGAAPPPHVSAPANPSPLSAPVTAYGTDPGAIMRRAAPPAPAPAPAAPVAAADASRPVESSRIQVTGSRIARPPAASLDPRAAQWLALIEEMLDRHLDLEARDEWLRFRRDYPEAPVAPALQQRIDALPPAEAR